MGNWGSRAACVERECVGVREDDFHEGRRGGVGVCCGELERRILLMARRLFAIFFGILLGYMNGIQMYCYREVSESGVEVRSIGWFYDV